MKSDENLYSKWQKIGLFLGPGLFVAFLVLPGLPGLPYAAQRMAAVAVLMAIWWISEAVPIAAVALLPLALYPLFGIMASRQVAVSYANHLVFLFLGGFLIAIAIERVNLHLRIALHILRAIGSSPRRLLLGFMVATAFLSMWISNTASTMMMLPIGMAVVHELTRQKEDGEAGAEPGENTPLGLSLMLAIAYSASIGGIGTLVGSPPNIVFAGFVRKAFPNAPEISFLKWMMVGFPLVVVFLLIAWVYLSNGLVKYLGTRIGEAHERKAREAKTAELIDSQIKSLGPMSKAERWVLIVFATTAFLWIFRQPLELGGITVPGWSHLFAAPDLFHDATVAMFMGLLLFLIPIDYRRGEYILNWKTAEERLPWGVLLLFGGGFALASGFQETGLAGWIGQSLGIWKYIPPLILVVLTCLLMTFLTELTSNTATTTMMMPVLAATAVGLDIHPFLLMIPGTISASCAFMMPVATPPNAIVFGSGYVTIPQMARKGLALNLIGVVMVTAVVYFVAFSVFGITAGEVPSWAK
jgi:sodium-dependent dicarboxylate transporter 2/3/5